MILIFIKNNIFIRINMSYLDFNIKISLQKYINLSGMNLGRLVNVFSMEEKFFPP